MEAVVANDPPPSICLPPYHSLPPEAKLKAMVREIPTSGSRWIYWFVVTKARYEGGMRAHLLEHPPVRRTAIVASREGFRGTTGGRAHEQVAIDSGKPRLWPLVPFMKNWFWRAMGMKYDRSQPFKRGGSYE